MPDMQANVDVVKVAIEAFQAQMPSKHIDLSYNAVARFPRRGVL
jgi:hypothetical protein